MFSLKIAYKGKNILLGKGTDSLKKIEQELNSRFPGQFPYGVLLKYQGNAITQFQQIQALATVSVNKSLKLDAEPAEAKKLDVIEEEKKSQISSAPSVPDTNAEIVKKEQQNQIKPEQNKLEEERPAVVEDVHEHAFEVNVSIDSESSQEQIQVKVNQKQKVPEELIVNKEEQAPIKEQITTVIIQPTQNKKQEQIVGEQYKPQIIKCAIFGEAPKEEQKQEPVKQEQQQKQVEVDEQKIEEKQVKNKYDSEIEACQEYVSIIKIEKDIKQIEPGVYQCIFCRQLQFCNACENKRRLGPGSKFFKLVDVIVEKKINENFTQLENKLLEKLSQNKEQKIKEPMEKISQIKKEQPKKEQPKKSQRNIEIQKQKERIRASHIQINDLTVNRKEVTLGEQIDWGFSIKLRQPIKFDHNVSIIDERTAQVKEITFKNDSVVLVGPFDAINQGKFDKTYRLCFVEQDGSLQLFGPKFGFSVMVSKIQKKKTLTNTFRQQVQQIKKAYKIERSTEYLIEKLKELGINEENYEQNKEILSDIIQTV